MSGAATEKIASAQFATLVDRYGKFRQVPLLAPITDATRVWSPTEVSPGLITKRQIIAPESYVG